MCRLNAVADATTEVQYEQALHALRSSDDWQSNDSLQSWFDNTWLSEKKVLLVCPSALQ